MVRIINVLLERMEIQDMLKTVEKEEVQMVVEDHLAQIVMILELLVVVQHFSMPHQVLIVTQQCFQREY